MNTLRRAPTCSIAGALFLVLGVTASLGQLPAETPRCSTEAANSTDSVLSATRQVRSASFPELANVDLDVRTFHSQVDYFRTRFNLSRFFLLRRMRYFVEVNPDLFRGQAPADGVCSVLAHELSHVVSLNHGNRIRRFGLVRLLSKGYTAQFERKTDLEAIRRGYGDGLKNYRTWVYSHIPTQSLAAKHRNYFSPEEITKIQDRLREQPSLLEYWSKHVPRNLNEILGNPK